MSIIAIPNTFTVGAVIIASQHNSNFSTIYSDYNGNITDANIAPAASLSYSKMNLSTSIKTTDLTAAAQLFLFPSGGIIMWSGTIATIPSGWFLCNGSNSTPDLRNRFIVGADADVSSVAKSTVTGSALQTSEGQLPSTTVNYGSVNGGASGLAVGIPSNGGSSFTSASFGTGTANVARFYALAYIMKS